MCLAVGAVCANPSQLQSQHNFDPASGATDKCYVVTRDGIQMGGKPGIDPDTGLQCRPLTPEVVERLRAYR